MPRAARSPLNRQNNPVIDNPPTKTSRIVELDALRALAAINLMLFHFTHVYSVKYGYTSDLGFEFPWGKYGVQLFFMLSGFVNAMTLLKKKVPSQFLASRFIRILPVYYVVVGVNLLLLQMSPFKEQVEFTWPAVVANLTLLPNLFGFECLEPVTWTLQIEILFYGILTSLFLLGAFRRPLLTMMGYLGVCLVGCLSIPAAEVGSPMSGWQIAREALLLEYMPLLIIGMLLQQIRFEGVFKAPYIAGILAAATVFHVCDQHGHNPAVTVLLTAILWLAAYGKLPVLRLKPLMFISTISYSLYLLHDNLGCFVIYHMNQNGVPPVVCFALIIPIVLLLSWLSSVYLERPLSGLLKSGWQRVQTWTTTGSVPLSNPLPQTKR